MFKDRETLKEQLGKQVQGIHEKGMKSNKRIETIYERQQPCFVPLTWATLKRNCNFNRKISGFKNAAESYNNFRFKKNFYLFLGKTRYKLGFGRITKEVQFDENFWLFLKTHYIPVPCSVWHRWLYEGFRKFHKLLKMINKF